jgi:hypothetical protein
MFLFEENYSLSRSEMSLSVPFLSHERARRMSRHDALSAAPLNPTISDDRTSTWAEQGSLLISPSDLEVPHSATCSYHPHATMYLFTVMFV